MAIIHRLANLIANICGELNIFYLQLYSMRTRWFTNRNRNDHIRARPIGLSQAKFADIIACDNETNRCALPINAMSHARNRPFISLLCEFAESALVNAGQAQAANKQQQQQKPLVEKQSSPYNSISCLTYLQQKCLRCHYIIFFSLHLCLSTICNWNLISIKLRTNTDIFP